MDQHAEVGADHAVAVFVGGLVVASRGRVLRDLAKDPRVCRCRAPDHDRIATGLGDHRGGVFRRQNVAIADHRDAHRILHGGDVLPARLAGVPVFPGPRMERDRVQAAVLGQPGELHADNVFVVPPHAELDRKGDRHGGADAFEDDLDQGQVAQQTGPAVAGDDALGRAAEVQIDEIEAGILADARGIRKRLRVRPEELCGDWVLVVVVGQVALALHLPHARQTIGGGELGHDEPATGLLIARGLLHVFGLRRSVRGELAGVLDEAAKDGVGNAGHGREHGRRRNVHVADGERRRHARLGGHGVLDRVVEVLLH